MLKFVAVAGGFLVVLLAFFFGRAVMDWRDGCPNRLHQRANPVNAASLLRLTIPDEADIPTEDLRNLERRAPFSSGAEVLRQRAKSAAAASEVFEELCQSGWTFEEANQYDRLDFTFGGEGDQRFCASQVIQGRFYMGYVPLCGSSRDYDSYIIVQRGDALFAAYESVTRWSDSGRLANEALSETMRQLR